MKIEKSGKIGFCYGVRRAVEILEKLSREHNGIESLGEIVHNEQVTDRLVKHGVKIIRDIGELKGNTIVLGAHGVEPRTMKELESRGIEIIDTTCPFVQKAQQTAKRLSEDGFFVIVYGDEDHAEVKGILGYTGDKGIAATELNKIVSLKLPPKVGILSQTTQIPARFQQFAIKILDSAFSKNSEIYIIDTICHDIRDRQAAALELAKKVDLMLVIGGKNSANTMHLAELCSTAVITYKINTALELKAAWFHGREKIGITAGSSTADETVDEVIKKLG
jgi:4-hydroxy-3-methylbut-2-en-1-yl diphosphate reductase